MEVTLIDHMGSDLTVVNAARVSFDKRHDNFVEGRDNHLINYLAEHGHWTPFGHPQIQLHVKAPIFVARQLAKHQTGLVWNEVSRRYIDKKPEYWMSEEGSWRLRAEDKKQGSSTESILDDDMAYLPASNAFSHPWVDMESGSYGGDYEVYMGYIDVARLCIAMYEHMLEQGVCPEQARSILPQGTYTEWYWTGSLAAFSRVCKLRLASDTQKETQEIARQIHDIMMDLFPVSWSALQK